MRHLLTCLSLFYKRRNRWLAPPIKWRRERIASRRGLIKLLSSKKSCKKRKSVMKPFLLTWNAAKRSFKRKSMLVNKRQKRAWDTHRQKNRSWARPKQVMIERKPDKQDHSSRAMLVEQVVRNHSRADQSLLNWQSKLGKPVSKCARAKRLHWNSNRSKIKGWIEAEHRVKTQMKAGASHKRLSMRSKRASCGAKRNMAKKMVLTMTKLWTSVLIRKKAMAAWKDLRPKRLASKVSKQSLEIQQWCTRSRCLASFGQKKTIGIFERLLGWSPRRYLTSVLLR